MRSYRHEENRSDHGEYWEHGDIGAVMLHIYMSFIVMLERAEYTLPAVRATVMPKGVGHEVPSLPGLRAAS